MTNIPLEQLYDRRLAGEKIKVLAREVGLSASYLGRQLKHYGWYRDEQRQIAEVTKKYRNGMTFQQIYDEEPKVFVPFSGRRRALLFLLDMIEDETGARPTYREREILSEGYTLNGKPWSDAAHAA